MARLGTFGGAKPRQLDVDDFVYFGEVIRVQPGASDLAYIDFMEQASSLALPEGMEDLTVDQAEGEDVDVDVDVVDGEQVDVAKVAELASLAGTAAGAVKGLLRELIHEEDFDLFWRTARRNGASIEDLMSVAWELLGAVSNRPTKPRSGSSPSRSGSGRGSKRAAGSRAGRTGRVMARLEQEGRPDLALAVGNARDARDAAKQAQAG